MRCNDCLNKFGHISYVVNRFMWIDGKRIFQWLKSYFLKNGDYVKIFFF